MVGWPMVSAGGGVSLGGSALGVSSRDQSWGFSQRDHSAGGSAKGISVGISPFPKSILWISFSLSALMD